MRPIALSLFAGVVLMAGCGAASPGKDPGGMVDSGVSGSGGGVAGGLDAEGNPAPDGSAATGGSAGVPGSGGAPGGDTGGSGPPVDGGKSETADAVGPGPGAAPNTVVLNGQQLAMNKQKLGAGDPVLKTALGNLLKVADAALTAGPWSVMDKTRTPSGGSKHDYLSLARYYWPSGAVGACPYTRRDGQTNPECSSNAYDHASRHAAMDAIYNLSLAWYFTDDPKYAQRAALVARHWFLDPTSAMNPNIKYGEVHCPNDNIGVATGVLNWTEVIGEALDGIAILDSGAPGWTAADQAAMKSWLATFLMWLQRDPLATAERDALNNHGTWYDTGVAAIMLYLGQTAQVKALVTGSQRRIASQITGDGSQPEELSRTNTWGYSNWNLEGFCLLAATADHVGVNLWGYTAPGGGTIAKATDFLIEVAEHGLSQTAWPYMQILRPIDQSWAVSAFHAATDFANDAKTKAALPLVPPPAGGDLWPLLPVCVPAAIQVN